MQKLGYLISVTLEKAVISRKCNGHMSWNLGDVQTSIATIGGTGFSKHSYEVIPSNRQAKQDS